jgi:hypothetical protein
MNAVILRGTTLLLLGLLVGGCVANRGEFGDASCAEVDRVAPPAGSTYAVYLDKDFNVLGKSAEDLQGTSDNKMCPTPPVVGPGACPTGYCAKQIGGTTICIRC